MTGGESEGGWVLEFFITKF